MDEEPDTNKYGGIIGITIIVCILVFFTSILYVHFTQDTRFNEIEQKMFNDIAECDHCSDEYILGWIRAVQHFHMYWHSGENTTTNTIDVNEDQEPLAGLNLLQRIQLYSQLGYHGNELFQKLVGI